MVIGSPVNAEPPSLFDLQRAHADSALARRLIDATCRSVSEARRDHTRPAGVRQNRLDASQVHALGWRHRIDLLDGIPTIVADYRTTGIAR